MLSIFIDIWSSLSILYMITNRDRPIHLELILTNFEDFNLTDTDFCIWITYWYRYRFPQKYQLTDTNTNDTDYLSIPSFSITLIKFHLDEEFSSWWLIVTLINLHHIKEFYQRGKFSSLWWDFITQNFPTSFRFLST